MSEHAAKTRAQEDLHVAILLEALDTNYEVPDFSESEEQWVKAFREQAE